jgi:hypothetical protein
VNPRLLLILHAVIGAATVAVSTHLALWSVRLARGQTGRRRGVRWFAAVELGLYVTQFALGNVMYPTYKVRVRAAYFDLPGSTLHGVARVFDIKEHWIALGLPLAVCACVLAFIWEPKEHGRLGGTLLASSAIGVSTCAWLGGLVGLYVTSFRSLASP